MKWLILVLLFSCGQKNPPAKDVSDSDGDQIPNYLEEDSELQKYVAEVIPFAKTEGTIAFKLDNKYESVKLSNEQDIARNAMRLLTKSISTLKTDDYFSEWSLLKLDTNSLIIPDGKYLVTLNLETTEKPDSITLTDGKSEIEIGSFSKRLEFTLSSDELRQILEGKLHLNMKRNAASDPYSVESTIRERTYRVFYYDGRISKIHYVSQELDFSRYLKLSSIGESYELKNFTGFSQNNPLPFWWTRNVGKKDKIVVKSSMKSLSEFNGTNFNAKQTNLKRNNGSVSNPVMIQKLPSSKFVAKIRGNKTVNTFAEISKSWHIGGARGEISEDCRNWSREINSTSSMSVTKEELLSGLMLQSKEKSVKLSELSVNLTEGTDKDGWYLELALNETPEEFTILLASRPENTYVKTGVYKTMCTHYPAPKYSGENTNIEGQMELKIESFIEKID